MKYTDITPAQWVLVSLANAMGFDKDNYDVRIQKVSKYVNELRKGTECIQSLLTQAEDKELAVVAALAIRDITEGVPTNIKIGLDACNSGPQLLSVAMRCSTGMLNTGAVGNIRPDLYSAIYSTMEDTSLSRTQVKRAAVPLAYGSTSVPEQVFGEQVGEFFKGYEQCAPAAFKTMIYMINNWNSDVDSHTLIAPDDFTAYMPVKVVETYECQDMEGNSFVYQKSVKGKKKSGKSLVANSTHVLDGYFERELTLRAKLALENTHVIPEDAHYHQATDTALMLQQCWKRTKLVSLRILEELPHGIEGLTKEYMDAIEATVLANRLATPSSFEVISVFDEFNCLPNYVIEMKNIYNGLLAELYLSEWMNYVFETLFGTSITLPNPDTSVVADILQNDYAIN